MSQEQEISESKGHWLLVDAFEGKRIDLVTLNILANKMGVSFTGEDAIALKSAYGTPLEEMTEEKQESLLRAAMRLLDLENLEYEKIPEGRVQRLLKNPYAVDYVGNTKIKAIKFIRHKLNLRLKESKELIDALEEGERTINIRPENVSKYEEVGFLVEY